MPSRYLAVFGLHRYQNCIKKWNFWSAVLIALKSLWTLFGCNLKAKAVLNVKLIYMHLIGPYVRSKHMLFIDKKKNSFFTAFDEKLTKSRCKCGFYDARKWLIFINIDVHDKSIINQWLCLCYIRRLSHSVSQCLTHCVRPKKKRTRVAHF